jgi:hypothetical protein
VNKCQIDSMISVHSRKLPDLSNEAAMLDPRCAVYSGLSGLLEDGSNVLDAAISLVPIAAAAVHFLGPQIACRYVHIFL